MTALALPSAATVEKTFSHVEGVPPEVLEIIEHFKQSPEGMSMHRFCGGRKKFGIEKALISQSGCICGEATASRTVSFGKDRILNILRTGDVCREAFKYIFFAHLDSAPQLPSEANTLCSTIRDIVSRWGALDPDFWRGGASLLFYRQPNIVGVSWFDLPN